MSKLDHVRNAYRLLLSTLIEMDTLSCQTRGAFSAFTPGFSTLTFMNKLRPFRTDDFYTLPSVVLPGPW